eukprot:g37713.t1
MKEEAAAMPERAGHGSNPSPGSPGKRVASPRPTAPNRIYRLRRGSRSAIRPGHLKERKHWRKGTGVRLAVVYGGTSDGNRRYGTWASPDTWLTLDAVVTGVMAMEA